MSDSLLSTLAERVRAERLRLGWTQSDVASRLGVSGKTYARFERSAAVTLPQLGKILEVLGLALLVVPASSVAGPAADPKAARSRRRGVRHAGPAVATRSEPTSKKSARPITAAKSKTQNPAPGTAPVGRGMSATSANGPARPAAEDIARIGQKHRDAILMLVRTIVMNGLTNYTSQQVVRNVLSAQRGLAPSDWPAFLTAVEDQLNGLTAESIATYGLGKSQLDRWIATWNRDLGFANVLTSK